MSPNVDPPAQLAQTCAVCGRTFFGATADEVSYKWALHIREGCGK